LQCLKAVAQKAWDKSQVVAWQEARKLISDTLGKL
jgi:hypothetical protein